MRVRIGKVIKAKSLLGQQNIPCVISSIGGGYSYGTKLDGSFLGGWNDALRNNANSKKISVVANHNYFCYVNLTATNIYRNVYNGVMFITPDSILRGNSDDNTFDLGYSVTCITPASDMQVIPALQNYHGYWTIGDIINYIVVIDLTTLYGAGNEITATQFYNKYKNYLSLLATGEEITIDDKAGQVQTIKSTLDDYIELEYIESNGEQYISTGVSASIDIGTDIVFKNTANYMGGIIGEDNTYAWNRYGLFRNGGQLYPMVCNAYSIAVFSSNDPWYHVNFKYPKLIIDNATYDLPTGSCGTGTIELFRMTSSYYSKIRVRSCKLYTSERVLRNFIPVIKKSNNEIGMLDRVNNVFYTNQGTGTFIAGPVKQLPSEYQQVEYIEGTGTQYISTNYKVSPNYNYNFEAKAALTANTYMNFFATFGFENTTGGLLGFGSSSSYDKLVGFFYAIYGLNSNVNRDLFPHIYKARYNKAVNNNLYLDVDNTGEVTYNNSTFNTGSYSTNNLTLLGAPEANPNYNKNKLYYFKLWDSDKVTLDLVPCYRKSDNVIGMYDLVNRVFYTNQGTGTFLKGNNVNNTISCKVAGGSSDIYYGYNQLNNNIELTWYYDNSASSSGKYASHTIGSLGPVALGDKILFMFSGTNHNSDDSKVGFYCVNANRQRVYFNSYSTGNVFTVEQINSGATQIQIGTYIGPNQILDIVGYISFINLTTWFGVGKEPTTVQEFKEKFTKDYYGFCPTPIKLTEYQIEALPDYGYNQLIKNGNFVDSSSWSITQASGLNVTMSIANGVMAITWDNSSSEVRVVRQAATFISGHKYIYFFDVKGSAAKKISVWIKSPNQEIFNQTISTSWESKATRFTASGNSTEFAILNYYNSEIATGDIIYFRNCFIIDLTDWYGSGDEPATIAEFKATFPNKYYPYSKKRLLDKYMINKLLN